MATTERDEFSRVVSVLTFYVFSCSYCYNSRPKTPAKQKEAAWIWREEIENGPSLLRRPAEQRRCNSSGGESMPSSLVSTTTSTADMDITTKPPEPQCMIVGSPNTIAHLPKIHPPVNERHPPVVSALPELHETSWMMLPPPTADKMRTLNRQINAQRNLSWEKGSQQQQQQQQRSRSGSASGTSLESGVRPTSAEINKLVVPHPYIPLEVENMVDGTREVRLPARRRVRYQEDVLDDMEMPSTEFNRPRTSRNAKKTAAAGPLETRRAQSRDAARPELAPHETELVLPSSQSEQKQQQKDAVPKSWSFDREGKDIMNHIEMVQFPPQVAMS